MMIFLLPRYFDDRLSHTILIRLKVSQFEVNSNVFKIFPTRLR